MVKGAARLWVVAISCALSGCADEPVRPSVESFCAGICAGAHRCDRLISEAACYSRCANDPRNASLSDVRPEAAAVVGDCLSELDCTAIFNGPFDSCWERAREAGSPSGHLVAFCPAYSAHAFECGYWYPVEDCRTELNIWTDAFLDELAACTRAPTCEATDMCLEARFGGG